jgi:hypothetical protein
LVKCAGQKYMSNLKERILGNEKVLAGVIELFNDA